MVRSIAAGEILRPGIVLIGHSIGGAIATAIAARQPKWPLVGIAISGVGLTSPPEAGAAWASLPDLPMLDLPTEIKDTVMFGPPWTFEAGVPVNRRGVSTPIDVPTV